MIKRLIIFSIVALAGCSIFEEDQDPRTMTCDVDCTNCEQVRMHCSGKGKARDTVSKEVNSP